MSLRAYAHNIPPYQTNPPPQRLQSLCRREPLLGLLSFDSQCSSRETDGDGEGWIEASFIKLVRDMSGEAWKALQRVEGNLKCEGGWTNFDIM